MTNIQIGSQVQVTMKRFGQDPYEFVSEVMDIVSNDKEHGVWVDHPECKGEDMLYISLVNPNINEVVLVKRWAEKGEEMKEAHKQLDKAFKWEEDEIKVMVKVYDCFEDYLVTTQSYDVEIQWAIGDDVYTDCVVIGSFYSSLKHDEVAEKDAVIRAKAVLRTIKDWFKYDDQVTVADSVEVYTM